MTRYRSSVLVSAAFIGLVGAGAQAQEAVTRDLTIKDHRFQPAEIRVPAGKPIALQVKNLDPTAEEFESKTLRVEKVIAGNSQAVIRLRALAPGRYTFVGEFNEATAKGVLIAE